MTLTDDFFKEETIEGYTVTAEKKRIWAVLLDLLEQFDNFCREFGLTYYADYGTLLGTIRHKGFIPWDDDIDVTMLRPDYNKVLKYADDYFTHPYYFQHYQKDPGIPSWGLSKLMNENTTCLEDREIPKGYHSGIFIDVWVYDDVINDPARDPMQAKMMTEAWTVIANPQNIPLLKSEGYSRVLTDDVIDGIRAMSGPEQAALLEELATQAYGVSRQVTWAPRVATKLKNKFRDRTWYDSYTMMPFENLMIPVPVGYDEILRLRYGDDYMTPKQLANLHKGAFFDPDRSYKEYTK